jgi:hypothetical protein
MLLSLCAAPAAAQVTADDVEKSIAALPADQHILTTTNA